jgi:hypothetical protein
VIGAGIASFLKKPYDKESRQERSVKLGGKELPLSKHFSLDLDNGGGEMDQVVL